MRSGRLHVGRLRGICACAAVAVAAMVAIPGQAIAASPVLEFVTPGFPVGFTAEGGAVSAVLADFDTEVQCSGSSGEGAITGARSTLSVYEFTGCHTEGGSKSGHECLSTGANPEEIRTPLIEAELVFIDQATRAVGMLLDPHGGVYIAFKCGGEPVEGLGPFLSPVGPINQSSSLFTATLARSGTTQVPDEYENDLGQKLTAIPTGKVNGQAPASTGVELGFAIHTNAPLTVRAVTAAEVAARQRDEEAAAKRHDEETAAAKKRGEEEAAARAAAKKREEEQAQAQRRARQLSKALKQCRKTKSGHRRVRCEKRAKKRLGPQPIAVALRRA